MDTILDGELLFALSFLAVLCSVGCTAILGLRHQEVGMRLQLRLFLCAFALRFAASILIYRGGLVSVLGDEDSVGWVHGVVLQETWTHQQLSILDLPGAWAGAFEGHHRGYRYLLGTLFYLTNAPYRLTATTLNAFLGAMTVIGTYRIAGALFSRRVAERAAWWVCLFPSMIVWSAESIKEPVVIFMETMALYACIRLQQRGFTVRHALLCSAAVIGLLPFRFYAAYIVVGAVLLGLVLRSMQGVRSGVIGIILCMGLIPAFLATGMLARHETAFERFDLERVQQFRKDVSVGGSRLGAGSGVATVDVRTTGGLVSGITVGAAHLLLAPFPWQLRGSNMRMALTLPELLVWWWLFFRAVLPGAQYLLRHRFLDAGPIFIFLAGFGLLYSLMFGNIGLVFRQRAQLLPWLFIVAAVGVELRGEAKSTFGFRSRSHGAPIVELAG